MTGRDSWAGYAAASWALIFAALHVVWAAGWYVGLDQESARKAFHQRWFLVYDLVVAGLCVVGVSVALALVRPWGRRWPRSLAGGLAWTGTAVLALRGGAGAAQAAYLAATGQRIAAISGLWQLWFCLGAVLFGLATVRFWRANEGDLQPMSRPSVARVVILGGGFGGLHAARALRRAPVQITLVDRTNHHLFQPLLYQVATATLAPSDIAVPIRWVLRRQRNATVLLGEADRVDTRGQQVRLRDGRDLPYDFLVVSTGTRHSYFGHDQWEPLAPGLKTLDDAGRIRARFLEAFEEAEGCADPQAQGEWVTFAVVGGGPTGVELAGIIPEIARAMRRDFRRVDTKRTKVVLLEAGARLLPSFPDNLASRARRDLESLGVEVHTHSLVVGIGADAVRVRPSEPGTAADDSAGGEERLVRARTTFWAAGNTASPLARSLDAPLDPAGRVRVALDLSLPGRPNVFVIGDLAALTDTASVAVPAVAPAAIQEGKLAGENIRRLLAGRPTRAFRYLNKGNLATIGRAKAIADFGRIHLSGFTAWVLWLFVHIMYLVGFRNRVSVLLQWAYAYFTYQRGARILTGVDLEATRATASRPGAVSPVEEERQP
jgi:NADH dehydrogenase